MILLENFHVAPLIFAHGPSNALATEDVLMGVGRSEKRQSAQTVVKQELHTVSRQQGVHMRFDTAGEVPGNSGNLFVVSIQRAGANKVSETSP